MLGGGGGGGGGGEVFKSPIDRTEELIEHCKVSLSTSKGHTPLVDSGCCHGLKNIIRYEGGNCEIVISIKMMSSNDFHMILDQNSTNSKPDIIDT